MQDKLYGSKWFYRITSALRNGETKTTLVQDNEVNRWSGIAFEMMGQYFVAPLGEVSEVIYPPKYTPVPNTQALGSGSSEYSGKTTFSFRFGTVCFWAK